MNIYVVPVYFKLALDAQKTEQGKEILFVVTGADTTTRNQCTGCCEGTPAP